MKRMFFDSTCVLTEKESIELEYYIMVEQVYFENDLLSENYGIQVVSRSNHGADEEEVRNITIDSERVYDLVGLMLGNEVMPGTLKDVLLNIL